MNTETKLREAMKVVDAARTFSAAVDGRMVRNAQDRLYKSVRIFDGLMAEQKAKDLALQMAEAQEDTGKSKLHFS